MIDGYRDAVASAGWRGGGGQMAGREAGEGCSTPGRRRYRLADEVVEAFARLDRLAAGEVVDAERLEGFVAARRRTRRQVREMGSALRYGTVASPLREGADVSRAWPLYRAMADA